MKIRIRNREKETKVCFRENKKKRTTLYKFERVSNGNNGN